MAINMFALKRKELVEEIHRQGIKSKRVLNAVGKVKRELFLDEEMKRYAYDNNALPIDSSQTISQPFTVAFMTELLDIKPGDRVLEIGTGSGYQAAILCELGAKVYSIERIEELSKKAKGNLEKAGCKIHLKCGDGTKGWGLHAPYDRIIVTAGSPKVPKPLLDQLTIDGKLIIPVGTEALQEMTLIKKVLDEKNEIKYMIKRYQDFKFVPLIGQEGWHTRDN